MLNATTPAPRAKKRAKKKSKITPGQSRASKPGSPARTGFAIGGRWLELSRFNLDNDLDFVRLDSITRVRVVERPLRTPAIELWIEHPGGAELIEYFSSNKAAVIAAAILRDSVEAATS